MVWVGTVGIKHTISFDHSIWIWSTILGVKDTRGDQRVDGGDAGFPGQIGLLILLDCETTRPAT